MDISRYIEHTNLSPTLTIREIDQCVEEAMAFHFLGICVPPFWVRRARREIGADSILLVTVVGWPFGFNMTETKLDEMKRAIDNGADELDVVWNTTAFKTGIPWTKIEIAKCARLAHDHQKLFKVIIETPYLSNEEIVEGCKLCSDAGADFLETSTGMAPTAEIQDHVKIMRSVLPPSVGIKASGGIETYDNVISMIQAGAERIGTSSAMKMKLSNKQHNP